MNNLNKSIRLKATPGEDKNLTIKLEQNFDFLEVLSLKISQQDLYNTFCANYGVVVGRVSANKGFGVPNAKVSIFIPITDEDESNELIKNLYPYKKPSEKGSDGRRYNLLLNNVTCDLNTPVGGFPDKETLLNNDVWIEVFEKYYKYTTKTNESGDYMLFGVPVGQSTIHMDVDLSDAGLLSIRPYDLIEQGAPLGFFESKSKFKQSLNLDTLPQIKSSTQSVDVIPFWGDPETCELGISRLDIDTQVDLVPNAFFIGSIFSDKEKNSINKNCNPTNKQGELSELRTGAGSVNFIRASKINPVEWVNNKKVIPTELETFDKNGGDIIDDDGTFVVTLPMNVGRVVTNEIGELVPSPDPEVGLPTKALYRMKMSFNEAPANRKRRTANMLFPSLAREHGGTAGYTSTGNINDINGTEDQRFTDDIFDYKDPLLDFHLFEWKQIYTIAQYVKKYKKGPNRFSFLGLKNTDEDGAEPNPLPFNTAVKKGDLLFGLLSFFVRLGASIISFFILLIGLEFGFYFGLKLEIFGACIFKFYKIIRIAPFGWVGEILPVFCDSPLGSECCDLLQDPNAKGFTLTCDDSPFCIQLNGNACGGQTIPCCSAGTGCGDTSACNTGCDDVNLINIQDSCGCPSVANDPNSVCETPGICIKGYAFVPSSSNCAALDALQDWECCVISGLAEQRNVIRRCLFDAWLIGSSYLFQYKYKSKIKKKNGQLIKKEKFCGPGSDTKGGNNYHKNKCCPHDTGEFFNPNFENGVQIGNEPGASCAKCLIRGSETSDKNYGNIEPYHKDWHNKTVNNNCNGFACGNGATDIGDNIYCNTYNSTKIVSLGRVEMCQDTLNEIESCILANNCVFSLYKQNPEWFTGTGFEENWDPDFWSNYMGNTSYQDPKEVISYFLSLNSCRVNPLFGGASGCHDKELIDEYYQLAKEISKIYTDVIIGRTNALTDLDQFEPGAPIISDIIPNPDPSLPGTIVYDEDDDGVIISGFEFDNRLGQRFHPCGGTSGTDCNQPPSPWSNQDQQTIDIGPGSLHNGSKNIPYYYFGLNPGKTAIEKLRKDFFVN